MTSSDTIDGQNFASEGNVIDEGTLLRRVLARKARPAAELLFWRHYTNLWHYAIRFVLSREIAEEAVAVVFANFRRSQQPTD